MFVMLALYDTLRYVSEGGSGGSTLRRQLLALRYESERRVERSGRAVMGLLARRRLPRLRL